MPTKYIIVFALFGIAVLIVLFPRFFSRLFRLRQPARTVEFAESILLNWDGHFWEGSTVLPSWAGFQQRLGPYASVSAAELSEGTVHLSISSPNEVNSAAPSEAQVRAFRYLRENDQAVRDKVLAAIFEVYPKWRDNYSEFFGEELDAHMPRLSNPSDLKPLIGLSIVHILNVEKDGLAYIGFEFGCTWEEEHGLGVMCCRDRIIEVGSAEEAFSASIANRDKAPGN
jgi:hypothetical protein